MEHQEFCSRNWLNLQLAEFRQRWPSEFQVFPGRHTDTDLCSAEILRRRHWVVSFERRNRVLRIQDLLGQFVENDLGALEPMLFVLRDQTAPQG